jgi:hypothetical protein
VCQAVASGDSGNFNACIYDVQCDQSFPNIPDAEQLISSTKKCADYAAKQGATAFRYDVAGEACGIFTDTAPGTALAQPGFQVGVLDRCEASCTPVADKPFTIESFDNSDKITGANKGLFSGSFGYSNILFQDPQVSGVKVMQIDETCRLVRKDGGQDRIAAFVQGQIGVGGLIEFMAEEERSSLGGFTCVCDVDNPDASASLRCKCGTYDIFGLGSSNRLEIRSESEATTSYTRTKVRVVFEPDAPTCSAGPNEQCTTTTDCCTGTCENIAGPDDSPDLRCVSPRETTTTTAAATTTASAAAACTDGSFYLQAVVGGRYVQAAESFDQNLVVTESLADATLYKRSSTQLIDVSTGKSWRKSFSGTSDIRTYDADEAMDAGYVNVACFFDTDGVMACVDVNENNIDDLQICTPFIEIADGQIAAACTVTKFKAVCPASSTTTTTSAPATTTTAAAVDVSQMKCSDADKGFCDFMSLECAVSVNGGAFCYGQSTCTNCARNKDCTDSQQCVYDQSGTCSTERKTFCAG